MPTKKYQKFQYVVTEPQGYTPYQMKALHLLSTNMPFFAARASVTRYSRQKYKNATIISALIKLKIIVREWAWWRWKELTETRRMIYHICLFGHRKFFSEKNFFTEKFFYFPRVPPLVFFDFSKGPPFGFSIFFELWKKNFYRFFSYKNFLPPPYFSCF